MLSIKRFKLLYRGSFYLLYSQTPLQSGNPLNTHISLLRTVCFVPGEIACEQALLFRQAKRASRERASEGRWKESLQRSLINFHLHPGNPGTPQSVKSVTANVPQIKKVTTACQVSLDSRGRVELLPPQGSGGRNSRRQPNIPRVKKKYRIVAVLVCENFLDLMKLGAHGGLG